MTIKFLANILNKTIFYQKYKYINLEKLLKIIESPNFIVVEFISSKNENIHHVPNAYQILKTNYENILQYISNKKTIIINNGTIGSRFYYNFLIKNGYHCYILKNNWK